MSLNSNKKIKDVKMIFTHAINYHEESKEKRRVLNS